MENKSLWYGDLHLHTNLSFCAPRETVPETYLPFCEEENTEIMGFSNHLYPTGWLGENERHLGEWPGVDRVLRIAPQLEELRKKTDKRILMGCEVETVLGDEPSLPYELAEKFDYVLLAASHIMNLPNVYGGYDLSTPDRLRDLTVERFMYACSLDYPVPTGICHPLYAICSPREQEVVDGISDSKLADCFSAAATKNLSIEIHACVYRGGTALDEDGISPSYLRILSAAKSCGCRFHFGSDAHSSDAFRGKHRLLRLAAEKVGITEADMWKL